MRISEYHSMFTVHAPHRAILTMVCHILPLSSEMHSGHRSGNKAAKTAQFDITAVTHVHSQAHNSEGMASGCNAPESYSSAVSCSCSLCKDSLLSMQLKLGCHD